jgi:alpha-L-fucosidase
MTIGLIIHIGLYSEPAFDVCNTRRGIQNGSEWYLKRLREKGTYRPISNYRETQEHHRSTYPNTDYFDFKLDIQMKNIDQWMKIANAIKASFVIMTTKHHDGFALWPSKAPGKSSSIDYMAMFKEAAIRAGLSFGFYYSWSEFGRGMTIDFINLVVIPQIDELKEYEPEHWWFDGDWSMSTKYAQRAIDNICSNLTGTINDRIGHAIERKNPDFLGKSHYRVYKDRAMPVEKPNVKWQHINTVGLSWGRNKQQRGSHYKSGMELLELYQRVVQLDGDFLINIGPDHMGEIDPYEANSLTEFSVLLV